MNEQTNPRGPGDPAITSSQMGLDQNRTLAEKCFRTIVLLALGGFFGIFSALVFTLIAHPVWKFGAQTLLEICWLFWLLAMVFVWWQPQRIRPAYLRAEAKMIKLASWLKYVALLMLVAAIVLITYLISIGVLPAKPK